MSKSAQRVLGLLGMYVALGCSAAPLCTVLLDGQSAKVLKQQGECEERLSPASTFKVALSLIGYDSGYLVDEHHPALPFREGYAALDPSWKTTVDPSTWMRNSVVWYSQQLTTSLGHERLERYLIRFAYGNRDLSGNPGMNDGLTQAWLSSSLRISPLEQAVFLQKVVTRQLPVSPKAYEMTARLTALGELGDGWDLHGKTGSGYQMRPDGPDLKRQIGWFIGWASRGEASVVFVYAIADQGVQGTRAGMRARSEFLPRLPRLLAAVTTP